jgi:hypothetical protein
VTSGARVEVLAADRPDAYLVRIDGHDQSFVDLRDPTRLEFPYMRRIGDVLDAVSTPGSALRCVHVGGAGLSLPRYVAATRPGSVQVVLEPDEEVTALVRELLPWPRRDRIKVRPVDGRTGLEQLRDAFADVLVVDAYSRGRVPRELVTSGCFAVGARVLRDDGLLLVNLSDEAPFRHTRRVVAAARRHLTRLMVSAEPATLRGRRPGNLLLVAGRREVPVGALRDGVSRAMLPYRVLDDPAVASSLGGGTPYDDDEHRPAARSTSTPPVESKETP